VLALTDMVSTENCGAWLADAYDRLYAAAKAAGIAATGPSGTTYAREFFEDEVGEVVAFVPVPAAASALTFTDVEQRGLPDPIRELYVVGEDETDDPANYRTDICWPIRPAGLNTHQRRREP